MTRWTKSIWMVAIAVALAAGAEATERHPIVAEQIRSLLHIGSASNGYQVTMPAVTSRVEDPRLKVESKQLLEKSVRLRIGCVQVNECLPFYVAVEFDSVEQAREFSNGTPTGAHHANVKPAILVRGGSIASLEVVSDDMRLYLYVRCLQSGSAGDVVRARDEQTHKVYLARVIDKHQLRSEP